MTASGSQYNVRQMEPLENRLLLKSYAQIPEVSGFKWAFSPAHAELSVASFFRSAPVRGSVVNLLIYLVDQLTRVFQSANNQFSGFANSSDWRFLVYGTRLQELEAKVAQIQLIVRISLHHLLSVGQ
jgi:hypothetical protein